MSINVELGDLVCYKQNLYVVSKTYKGGLIVYVDLNNCFRRISINEIAVLNIHQNLCFLSHTKCSDWSEDIVNLYLKRFAKKTPINILKKEFVSIGHIGLTDNQHKFFFDRLYKEWTYQELIDIEEHIDEYNFTEKEKEIIERRIDYITFYKPLKVYYK